MTINIEQPNQLKNVQKVNKIRKIKRHTIYKSNSFLLLPLSLKNNMYNLKRITKARQIGFTLSMNLMNHLATFKQKEFRKILGYNKIKKSNQLKR